MASAAAAYLLGFVFIAPANPEIQVWRKVEQRRDGEIASARAQAPNQPVILFTGGSSTAFSVDPALIEQSCGIRAFNLAFPAAAGPRYLLDQALERSRSGDILVIGLEADFLAFESDYPASMFSFGLAVLDGKPSATVGGESLGEQLTVPQILTLARPGPRYLMTLLYRGLSGKGYRYTLQDYRYHGRMETSVEIPDMVPHNLDADLHLSRSGERLLRTFRDAASQRGIRLFYAMPWRWTSPEHAEISRRANAALLRDIDPIISVVDDGTLGVSTERSHFSDSHQHLTATGSRVRTLTLAAKMESLLREN
ncbi:hypothetical protein [Luteolibacter soli]|uniref:SGNH/GDSL hydrolase family protein n=1 Tax=Luteolibacter soli TaxID=3135280 RepID=A0ABU9ASU9_9BACT